MISGALLLDDSRKESPIEFYKRRVCRLGIPLVAWTVVYLVVRKLVNQEELSARSIARLIITADLYYHLWFLYMIPGLYLITPPLRTFVRNSSRKERLFVIVTILVLANVYFQADTLIWKNQRSIFTMFIPYIAYYLCGYELRHIDPRKIPSRYLVVVVIVCALYLTVFSGVFLERQGGIGGRFVFDFFSLPVAIMSIAIFWAAYLSSLKLKPLKGIPKTAVEWIASTTLGIYVIHPIVLEYMRNRLGKHASDGTFLLSVIAIPLVTFAVCYLITSVIMNVPVLRRTVC
jgi:surface polysaccharide O-acyltransferase-like enzyme